MARLRQWSALGAAQQRRYERAGITKDSYEAGVSLQRARGHAAHEHRARPTRAGVVSLSSTDRAFIAKQQKRSGADDFTAQRDAFRRLSPRQREALRRFVRREEQEYRRRKSKATRSLDTFRADLRGGGGGGGGGGDGGGGGGGDDYEFGDWFDDIPFEDDDFIGLLFYH